VRLPHIEHGHVNRMREDEKFPGGKGINVSRVLQTLSIPNTATGFVGGFTGKFIEDKLEAEGIRTAFTPISKETRINVKIKSDEETEINAPGPDITDEEVASLMATLEQVQEGDIVVLAGSTPANLGNAFYKRIMPLVRDRGAKLVCDFEGQTLVDSLEFNPLLVKPNNHELGAIYGVELEGQDQIIPYAKRLQADGAENVIISMAGDGALMVTAEAVYFAPPIKGVVKNSVGAGDSMVAGFTGKFHETGDVVEAFKWGVACGTATAFSDDLADLDWINEKLAQVAITKL
jgi:1-phosphofructokinase